MANSKSAAQDALMMAQQALDDHAFGRLICCYESMTLKLCRALVASAKREDKLREALTNVLRDWEPEDDGGTYRRHWEEGWEVAGGSDGK